MPRLWPHPLDPEPTPGQARWLRLELSIISVALAGSIAATVVTQVLRAEARPRGEPTTGCRVIDGNTMRCGRERVRLLGIKRPVERR
jgi:hypothetical protein